MSIKPTLQVLAKMEQLPVLPLSYSPANSDGSATKLVYTLLPEWNPAKGGRGITIVRFTDGITNTVCCLFIFFPLLVCFFCFYRWLPCIHHKHVKSLSMTTGRNGVLDF